MPSKIEWLHRSGTSPETWNFIGGCTKVSDGCRNCYACRLAATRLKHHPMYRGTAEMLHPRMHWRYSHPQWTGRVRWDRTRSAIPMHWRKPRTIFVCSTSDLFHPAIPPDVVQAAYSVMSVCRQHTFIIVTKRPERIVPVLYKKGMGYFGGGDYLPNVWHLVTAENQPAADERIPELFKLREASPGWPVLGVSVEPMLEALNFLSLPESGAELDWVICGAETGPNARPMKLKWARDLHVQCKQAGVPFFMKKVSKGQRIPDDLMVREFP